MGRILPILFNTDMVRAILEDRKTATRRAMKPQPGKDQNHKLGICIAGDKRDVGKLAFGTGAHGGRMLYVRPQYRPGDILYVRETWAFIPCIECPHGEGCGRMPAAYEDSDSIAEGCFIYRADHPWPERITWRPSIHMPRAAARLWLEVKSVEACRLRDMTLDDFLSEGVVIRPEAYNDPENAYMQARDEFAAIWDSTIPGGQQASYGWEADPWVWGIGFERCGKPEGM